jgi:hypothetical protein
MFPLADLAIAADQYKSYFNEDVDMVTTWHETYFTDMQSRQKNIYKYKCYPEPIETYKYIKCRHFAHNDIFCSECVKQIMIGGNNSIHMSDDNDKCYGFIRLVYSNGIYALHILLNELTDNYFKFENIKFNTETMNAEEIECYKNNFYLNPHCKKIVSIGGYVFGCDMSMMTYFTSLNIKNNYKIHIYFNFDHLKKNETAVVKTLFSNRPNYITKYEKLRNEIKTNDNIIVCGHLRAGDYSVGNTFIYYVLYYTYYVECLKNIQEKHQNKHINFVLCFHPSDIKLGNFYKKKIEEHVSNITILFESDMNCKFDNEIDHIHFMGLYGDYYLASNSSYSFWSVFLKGNHTKIYYPKYYGIRYEGTKIENIRYTSTVAYRFQEYLYPNTEEYIAIVDKKILHPVYYAILMKDLKIRDYRKEINVAFKKEEFDNLDRPADICFKNVLATLTQKTPDIVNYSCNINLKKKYGNYTYDVHLYHLKLHSEYVANAQYNFDNIDELYTDENKSTIKYIN